jgi:hypothetical protein
MANTRLPTGLTGAIFRAGGEIFYQEAWKDPRA